MAEPIVQAVTVDSNHTAAPDLVGYSFEEDAGAAAQIELRVAAVGGAILAHINFAANESVTVMFPKALPSQGGVYVKEVSGSVTGEIYHTDKGDWG